MPNGCLFGLFVAAVVGCDEGHIHFPDNMAFIATDSSGGTEIGVARYSMTNDDCAEFAVVVADAWQGLGVGTLLLRHLFRCAEIAGIKKVEGDIHDDGVCQHRCRVNPYLISAIDKTG